MTAAASMPALVARVFEADARIAADDATATSWDEVVMGRNQGAFDQAVTALTARPARSPAELAAKARALMVALRREVDVAVGMSFEGQAEPHDLLAMALARDAVVLAERAEADAQAAEAAQAAAQRAQGARRRRLPAECPVSALAATAARGLAAYEASWARTGSHALAGAHLGAVEKAEDAAATLRARSLPGALFQLLVAFDCAQALREGEIPAEDVPPALDCVVRAVRSAIEVLIDSGVPFDRGVRDRLCPPWLRPFASEPLPEG